MTLAMSLSLPLAMVGIPQWQRCGNGREAERRLAREQKAMRIVTPPPTTKRRAPVLGAVESAKQRWRRHCRMEGAQRAELLLYVAWIALQRWRSVPQCKLEQSR